MRIFVWVVMLLVICSFPMFVDELASGERVSHGFAVEPYVLDVTTDAATVAFHLRTPLAATVSVFSGDTAKEFVSPKESISHFIRITGLEPGRTYTYEVICGDGTIRTPEHDRSFQIKTAIGPGKSFGFVVYGDPRPGDTGTQRHHQSVVEQTVMHEPAFALVLGDMVDDGAKPELWEEFFRVESPLLRRSAIYPLMGDNDYASGAGLYSTYFPKLEKGYYTFEWGGVQFFGMHTWDTRGLQSRAELAADSPQVTWLTEQLSKPAVQAAPFRVVFLHDPIYISRGRAAEILQRVWAPLLQQYKVDVVFASWHLYERSHHNGITYIISGGAGAEIIWMEQDPAYPSQAEAREYHFCRVDVQSDAMTIRAISTDGTVLDNITLTPRSRTPESADRLARVAKRLRKEIVINGGRDLPELPVYLFSYDCGYCRRLLKYILPDVAKAHNVALTVSYFDLGIQGMYDLFLNAGAEFGRQGADIPALFIGRSVFGGESEIEDGLVRELSEFRNNQQRYREQMIVPFQQTFDTKTLGEDTFNALTFGVVLGAGLLDGINPCAFTTIIFLISYLSLFGVSRRKMLYTGSMFTLAVFLTYFVIGLVFYNYLKVALTDQTISRLVNVILLCIVLVLGGLSLVDFFRALKGDFREMTLQLPTFVKLKIHERIRNFTNRHITILWAPFVLGVVIAGMELTCTGQVYIPIVTMISEPRHRMMAVLYLVCYNLAFIVPLVIVFLLAAFGITSERVWRGKRYVPAVKLGLTLFFFGMAILILHNLGVFQ